MTSADNPADENRSIHDNSVANSVDHRSVYIADCDVGKGLFAAEDIPAGNAIVPFSGPVISLSEVRAKGPLAANALQISPTKYLDLQPPGRLANHSCQPNAGVFIRHSLDSNNRKLADNVTEPAFELRALVDIPLGTEIRFDYSTTVADGWTMRCRCGATNCRGVVRAFLTLPRRRRDQYSVRGCVMPFILEFLGS